MRERPRRALRSDMEAPGLMISTGQRSEAGIHVSGSRRRELRDLLLVSLVLVQKPKLEPVARNGVDSFGGKAAVCNPRQHALGEVLAGYRMQTDPIVPDLRSHRRIKRAAPQHLPLVAPV